MKINQASKALLAVFSSAIFSSNCFASLAISNVATPTVITFDSSITDVSNGQFTGSGFQSTPTTGQLDSDAWAVTGWSDGALAFGGTRTTASTDYTRGTTSGAVTTGGIYSFGTTDRQLMIQPGGSDWAPGTITLKITNTTGFTMTDWTLGYDLFVRNDQARSSSFNFSYSTDGTTFLTTGLSDALFSYTSTAVADALGWRKIGTPSATITATVLDGADFYVRWSGADVGGTGSRDEFGIDNISIATVPEPSAALFGALSLLGILRRRR